MGTNNELQKKLAEGTTMASLTATGEAISLEPGDSASVEETNPDCAPSTVYV